MHVVWWSTTPMESRSSCWHCKRGLPEIIYIFIYISDMYLDIWTALRSYDIIGIGGQEVPGP